MRVGLIGAGNMAGALARGWGDPVLCCDGGSGRARELAAELGGEALRGPREVAERADLVVLAHKPAQLAQVAPLVREVGRPVASVLGGVPLEALGRALPGLPLIRLMPNTAVEVRRGVTCLTAGGTATPELIDAVENVFSRLGTVVRIAEAQMGAATAVMGVGPAYVALVAEAQVDAAVRHGLKAPLASQLVVETLAGTAALLEHRGYDTLAVRREVTSPGGGTARGLAALERGGLRAAFHSAMDAILSWERGQ